MGEGDGGASPKDLIESGSSRESGEDVLENNFMRERKRERARVKAIDLIDGMGSWEDERERR